MRGFGLAVAGVVLLTGFLWRGEDGFVWRLPPGFPEPPVPADNPMSAAKVELGRYLFYDARLSITGAYSCASCHQQRLAFTDGRSQAVGATGERHRRSSMSLANVGYSPALGWSDPGMTSLEAQVLVPLTGSHPVELGMAWREETLLAELRAEPVYQDLFPRAFGRQAFTIGNLAKAIAAFERTIVSGQSPYDRYYTGGDREAISETAKRGEALFFTDGIAGCYRCHGGFYPGEAGTGYRNTALYDPYGDTGLFEHSGDAADAGRFKAPSLRNIAVTAPYMHDGSVASLGEVLDLYAAGGRAPDNPRRDPLMTGFPLTRQNRSDLLAFLESLTDEEFLQNPRYANPW